MACSQAEAAHRVCLAPMMDYTDRHFRFLLRLVTQHTFLYTEMRATGALLHGAKREQLLQFSRVEHPIALQLGGNQPQDLAACAKMAQEYGYDEVNLNVGCPSPRVKNGQFGASLMLQPDLVKDCLAAMQDAVSIPVSIKTRIGVDHHDDYQQLQVLVEKLDKIGIRLIIVHARKAWLQGLSPKDNRNIPPLRYDFVYQIKQDFPHLEIIINGGIKTLPEMQAHLRHVDGVMIGREAYHNCYLMRDADSLFETRSITSPTRWLTRKQIMYAYMDYMAREMQQGTPFRHLARHTMGLFYGCRGASAYRRMISKPGIQRTATPNLLETAMRLVECDE